MLEAEKLMEDARALCLKLDVPDHVRVEQLGLLDIRCIYYICNRGKEAEGKEFKSIKDIADVFIAEIGGTLITSSTARWTNPTMLQHRQATFQRRPA